MSVLIPLTIGPSQAQWPEPAETWLVFLENPAVGLAAVLAAGDIKDPARWLSAWCASARRVLGQTQRDPLRCLLLDAVEARGAPQLLAAACRERFGVSVEVLVHPSVAVDPLSQALGDALAFADREVQALYVELQASCAVLDSERFPSATLHAGLCIDGLAAARHLRELRCGEQYVAQLLDARSQFERADEERKAVVDENELLLLQLHQVQEELEHHILRCEDLEAAAALAVPIDELLAARRLAEDAVQELSALRDACAERDAVAERDRAELGSTQAAIAGHSQAMTSVVEENELLLLQLHQMQEELERHVLRCQDLETAAALAVSADELFAARREAEDAAQALSALRDASAENDAAVDRDRAELGLAQATVARHSQEVAAVVEENELLLLQLHQVQEELEHCYLQCSQLEGQALVNVPAAGQRGFSIADVQPITERNAAPHRELGFALHHVAIVGRQIDQAAVRLVEHHGHPGLVVFGQSNEPHLLQCWRETGREDGRPYALLVPADANSLPMFEAMGADDWSLTQALVAAIETRLGDDALPVAPRWRHVARRLRDQLQELPARFRYSSLVVRSVADSPSDGWEFCFGGVSSGVRRLDRLVVYWRPFGPRASLELLCDADAVPPLSWWPDDGQSVALDRLRLPFGPGCSKQDRRQRLARMPAADRSFVLTLLAAWPQAVTQLPASVLDGGADARALEAAATSLLHEARNSSLMRADQGLGGLLNRLSR